MAADGVLVIGYGNSVRGDDGAGPAAARRLRELGYAAIEAHQLVPELAERIAGARRVFFLDASAGVPPGEISVEALERCGGTARQPMEHHASPAALLRLALDAYGAAPEAWLIGLGCAHFDLGESLSEAAEQAVARTVGQVLRIAP